MLVLENPNGRPNAGERAFIAHQRGKKGIALVNFLVGGGGPRKPGREVDAIMILPCGVFAVEVKHTRAVGVLDAPLNDAWSVGEIGNPFSSSSRSPSAQADQAAKILASHLASKDWPKGYITPVVSVHGQVTVTDKVQWVGTVGVSTVEHFDLVVRQARSKRIQARHVGPMLERLGVSKQHVPSMERLLAEGFAHTPEPEPEPDPEVVAKPTPEPEPTRAAADQTTSTSNRWARAKTWWGSELPQGRGAVARTGAITALVTLAATALLMTGTLFDLVVTPEVGQRYFVYGTWQESWTSVRLAGEPGLHAFTAPAVGAVLVALLAAAQWLRMGVGGLTRRGMAGFWGSIFTLIVASPVLFAEIGWFGVWLAWVGYVIVWPLVAIVAREVSKANLAEHVERVWREYEI